MEQKEITVNNKKFFYRVIGEGPVVILLHGFGEDGSIWHNQFNAFSGFKLIIPDLPGSGRSAMIEDMSMEGLADWLKEIISPHSNLPPTGEGTDNTQLLSIGNANNLSTPLQSGVGVTDSSSMEGSRMGAIIIGHSMGGYVALAFAEKYSELLNGLGLFHSTAYADSEEKKQIRKKGIQFIQQHGGFEFLKTTIPNLYSPVTRAENPVIIEEQIDSSHNFSDEALVSYYESMIRRPDRTEILKKTNLPVFFILGKYDTAVPLEDGLKLCHMPGISYIHLLERSGHMGMREEPDKANGFLLDFLKSIYHQAQ